MFNAIHMYIFNKYAVTGHYIGAPQKIDALLIFWMSAKKNFIRKNYWLAWYHFKSGIIKLWK